MFEDILWGKGPPMGVQNPYGNRVWVNQLSLLTRIGFVSATKLLLYKNIALASLGLECEYV